MLVNRRMVVMRPSQMVMVKLSGWNNYFFWISFFCSRRVFDLLIFRWL